MHRGHVRFPLVQFACFSPNAPRAKECAMLVLTRKLQQQIKIGEEIVVTILRVKGNTVRVGVQAPREVRVVRGELPKNGEESALTEPEHAGASELTILSAQISEHAETAAEE